MKYSKEQLKEKLKSCYMKDLKTGKVFYSLEMIFKEFNIKHFAVGLVATTQIFKKMDEISYPCRTLYQLQKNASDIVVDVYLNPVGLMLVLASTSQKLKDRENKEVCSEIANLLKDEQNCFYPDRRLLYREEFKENFKLLSSRVKQAVDGDYYRSVSGHLSRLHYTIISEYYGVSDIETITYKKTGAYNKNYLDYISLRELKDLSQIQKTIIQEIERHPNIDFISLARSEAIQKRRDFYLKYAGMYPLEYRSHSNSPKRMIKDFDKLLKELDLTPEDETRKNELTPF